MRQFTFSSLLKKRVGLRSAHFFALTNSTTHWRLLALIANILLFLMCTLSYLFSQSNHYGYIWLSNHRMLVFNVKVVFIVMLFLWSFLVALLYRGVVFYSTLHKYLRWNGSQWVSFCPSSPLSLFSLYLRHSVGVAAFNVCVKQNLNLDIKLILKNWWKKDKIVTSSCLLL